MGVSMEHEIKELLAKEDYAAIAEMVVADFVATADTVLAICDADQVKNVAQSIRLVVDRGEQAFFSFLNRWENDHFEKWSLLSTNGSFDSLLRDCGVCDPARYRGWCKASEDPLIGLEGIEEVGVSAASEISTHPRLRNDPVKRAEVLDQVREALKERKAKGDNSPMAGRTAREYCNKAAPPDRPDVRRKKQETEQAQKLKEAQREAKKLERRQKSAEERIAELEAENAALREENAALKEEIRCLKGGDAAEAAE